MKVRAIVLYLSILWLFKWCTCDFPQNSIFVPAVSGSSRYLQVYDIAGHRLKQISMPSGKSFSSECATNLYANDTLMTISMYDGTSPYANYGYVYRSDGGIRSTTTLTSQSSTPSSFIVDGDDSWFLVGTDVVYKARGTSGSGTIIASNVKRMQLVGSNLYVIVGTSLQVMSPVVKTGTGTLLPLVNAAENFHIKGRVLYTSTGGTILNKYVLNEAGTTADFSFGLNVGDYVIAISSLLGIDDSRGIPFVVMLFQDVSYSYLYRCTDIGYNFDSFFLMDTSDYQVSYLSIGASPIQTCSDGLLNQDETSADCGGNICGGCSFGQYCLYDKDCLSSKCTSFFCAASCTDGIKNQDETDIDCGGATCGGCAIDKICTAASDCLSNKCTDGYCAASCSDGLVNQDETDVDCGGIICNNGCSYGKICAVNSDCLSLKCTNLLCDVSCSDGVQNQNETGIDCGGPCSPCADGNGCLQDSDCKSNYCNPNNLCSMPSCGDGFKNQDETDIDCGGLACTEQKCSNGQNCVKGSDCASDLCNSVCVAPPVAVPMEVPFAIPGTSPINAPSDQSPVASSPITKAVSTAAYSSLSMVSLAVNFVALVLSHASEV